MSIDWYSKTNRCAVLWSEFEETRTSLFCRPQNYFINCRLRYIISRRMWAARKVKRSNLAVALHSSTCEVIEWKSETVDHIGESFREIRPGLPLCYCPKTVTTIKTSNVWCNRCISNQFSYAVFLCHLLCLTHCNWMAAIFDANMMRATKGPFTLIRASICRVNDTIRYDTRCYFNVRSKADISQLNLPHGTDN